MRLAIFVVVVLGVALWFMRGIATQKVLPQKFQEKSPQAEATQSDPPPALDGDPVEVRPSQIEIVRGIVVGSGEGVLIVDCVPDEDLQQQWGGIDLGPAAGAAAGAAMAKWAVKAQKMKIEREFGPLEFLPIGKMRAGSVDEKNLCTGRIALSGYPRIKDRLNVCAVSTGTALDGMPLFTVNFMLAGAPKPTPVPSMFPPGVDTPEQRREFLKSLSEAKKNGLRAPAQSAIRDRGY